MTPSSSSAGGVALILLNWHDEERTIAAVRAAVELDVYDQIIVVDNESTTHSRDRLIADVGEAVTLVSARENRGYGGGHNLGFAAARDDIHHVMLLNTDAVIDRASVLGLRAFLEAHPETGAVGPIVYDFPALTGETVQTAGAVVRPLSGEVHQRRRYEGGDRDPDYVTFAACMLRRSALPDPPFDERQFMYWEDVDVCLTLRERGHRVAVEPTASAWHELSASGGTAGARLLTYTYWSGRVFARKHRGVWPITIRLRGLASAALRALRGRREEASAVLLGLRLPIGGEPAWAVREALLADRRGDRVEEHS